MPETKNSLPSVAVLVLVLVLVLAAAAAAAASGIAPAAASGAAPESAAPSAPHPAAAADPGLLRADLDVNAPPEGPRGADGWSFLDSSGPDPYAAGEANRRDGMRIPNSFGQNLPGASAGSFAALIGHERHAGTKAVSMSYPVFPDRPALSLKEMIYENYWLCRNYAKYLEQ